jgi:hypothetical protein
LSFFSNNSFRITQFNVENLFVLFDQPPEMGAESFLTGSFGEEMTESQWQRLSSSTTKNKPLRQVIELARAIKAMNPDIMILSEVGGRESLANFNRYFLGDHYSVQIIEGNSDRGIDLGFLVKKSLPFEYEINSHKNRSIDFLYPHEVLSKESGYGHIKSARRESHRFSRDLLELRVFEKAGLSVRPSMPKSKLPSGSDSKSISGIETEPAPELVLILLAVHLKSQLDPTRIDPGGKDRRRAELEKLVEIMHEIRDETYHKVPLILAGDFNGVAQRENPSDEFQALIEKTEMRDCLDLAERPLLERFTYQQFYNRRPSVDKQLDYIFLDPQLHARVNRSETEVFRYTDVRGQTQMLPRNLTEKKMMPSDHFPVFLVLDRQRSEPSSAHYPKESIAK